MRTSGHDLRAGMAGQAIPEPVTQVLPEPAGRRVTGNILHADGSAISGMLVQAFHRRLGGELSLGVETLTNDRGGYLIVYQPPGGVDKIDLFVRAYSDGAVVAVSAIIIDAHPQEILDLTVTDPRYRGPSEFARATGKLAPYVAGTNVNDLDADDVALLVRSTGILRTSVTAWIASMRLAECTEIDHESLYALVRVTRTASLPRLLRRSSKRLLRSLADATEANLISHAAGRRAPTTVTRLRQVATTLSIAHDTPGSLGRLLATSRRTSSAQQARFIERHAAHEGPVRALWAALRDDPEFGNNGVDDLQLSLRLGTLTANHPPLVQALRAAGLRHAAQTAMLGIEGWRQMLRTRIDGTVVGTPPNIKGATDAERENNYIRLLTQRCARAYPTAHVAKTLKTLPAWQSSGAVAFLDDNPDFNLLTARIRARLDAADVLVRPGTDRGALEAELGTVQRVARVAPRGKEEAVVNGLLAHGYTSALSISRQSRATFRRATAASLGDDATADAVYGNAQFQVARAVGAYAIMHPSVGGGLVTAIGTVSPEVTSDATWVSLFGNLDYCACQHCGSIYGPAAYLVDLLSWLDGHDAGQKTGFERLNQRRPDIQRIELSCENVNTVLPYVDLVNEILEVRVLNPTGNRPSGPAVPTATTGTSPELLANPEYLNAAAYDEHLARAVFPHTLPFDLWGELGRVYFAHLGVRRSDLMEKLRRQQTPSGAAIDTERLRLSTPQRRILTGAASHDVWQYWGFDSASPDGIDYKLDLAVVSHFLRRADVDYDQLLDLLHSRFVNPTGGVDVTGTACDTDELRVVGLTDEVLGRVQRFLRLWHNRGATMLELDKALHALNITTLDAAGLARLANLDRVRESAEAPLLEALSWWATIDTFADRPAKDEPVMSLYDRVYLNRAVDATAGEPDFLLALNSARDALAHAVTWDGVRTILQAALSIDSDDLALLLDETVDGLPNPQRVVIGTDATLDGLSALYRYVSLARRLKLTVGELLGVLRLTGVDPFDGTNTDAMVGLLETVGELRSSEFSLLELQYLLEHDPLAETSVGVTDEAIGQVLVDLRDGLARVAADFAVTEDPVGEVTARYLAVVLPAESVAAVTTALRTVADTTNHADLEATLTDNLGSLFSFDAAALIDLEVERRFNALAARLAPYVQVLQGTAVIIEKVAGFAGREPDSVQDLLTLRARMTVDGTNMPAIHGLRSSPYRETVATEITAVDDVEAFAALRRIHKAALVMNTLGIDIDAQIWLFDIGVHNGLLNPLALPIVAQPLRPGRWPGWTRLVDVATLAHDLPGGEPSLVELLQLLESADDPVAAEETFRATLATRTGWLRADLDTFVTAFAPAFPADWRDGRLLRTLVDAFALIERLGVPAAQADSWATADIGATQADDLRLAAKSKHDEQRWPAIARALRDPVRGQQRVALVDYLIATTERYADEEDLFGDLLIDVEMEPCMLTSRIKQAISSVQLFVQRAFLNLEDGLEFARTDSDEWEWMKNYRVWEAARKVFLYPENWIEPELRLDKSPLFDQLETSLQQGELDDAAAETAYTRYLEGLLKIARMEVMSLYHQLEEDDDGRVDILHVVARTKAQPHEYYYRQWVDARDWTAWKRLDGEIEGDHIILAVHDRRLFVFWPVVAQKALDIEVGKSLFEMKIAWIERMNERWGPRHLSTELLVVDDALAGHASWEDMATDTFFRLGTGDELVVECHRRLSLDQAKLLGTFTIDSCTGTARVARADETGHDLVAPSVAIVSRMRFTGTTKRLQDGSPYFPPSAVHIMAAAYDEAGVATSEVNELAVFGVTDRPWDYVYPAQYGEFASQHGVFLDDEDRTFHVMPHPGFGWYGWAETDGVQPTDVGTTDTGSDSIQVPQDDPPFEPDIPWDKNQEPPIIANVDASRAMPGTPVALSVGAAPDSVAIDLAAGVVVADTLSTAGLQQSQTQLGESWVVVDAATVAETTKFQFSLFYHPYVCDFMAELRRAGVSGLLDPNPDGSAPRLVRQAKSQPDFFVNVYEPTSSVSGPYPTQDIDFNFGGAYARYNWELFFHAPMLIASRLSHNQRFEEARRWFHYMFDPTNRSDDADPLRFWKIKPFYREPDAPIEAFLALAASTESSPEADLARADYDQQIEAWRKDSFSPHGIAELRDTAYQKTLVMKYLDNLIAWGDQLFRRDTIESINEATQLYILALQLLGERPDPLPPRSAPVATTFEQVRGELAGSVLTNPLVQLENLMFQPGDAAARTVSPGAGALSAAAPSAAAANAWTSLMFPAPPALPGAPAGEPGFYFCIPPNDKLLVYWDVIEDRLFKIRHCMNIQGVVRQLPLFEPPIDPGMLVRARAAGIDLSSALSDLSAPLPYYRFPVMLQKTYTLNQTVRALGAALLGALEKNDGEALAVLRAHQEEALLAALRQVKTLTIEEARHSLAAAQESLAVVQQRHDYYENLLKTGLLAQEKGQIALMAAAGAMQVAASSTSLVGAMLAPIPRVDVGVIGIAPTTKADVVDGAKLAKVSELASGALAMLGNAASVGASIFGVSAGWQRRTEEWKHQSAVANREIAQINKQIEAAGIRISLAEHDLDIHDRQIDNARSVRELMEQKFTNVELYQWMVGQLSTLYFQSYQLAYDLAKQAERAYRHELALPDATFIQFGYWDSLKKGLLAGERLEYDLQRMDAGYLQNNSREYELTRHVSLALIDPVALTQLQTAGACEFSVPEALFDLDYPGQYLRRIKSVGVTVPCVTGPYTGVPMRLTLVSSRTRIDPSASGDYALDTSVEDPRFQVQTGAVQSIALNGEPQSGGLFTVDHRDERYLPFEGSGAISDWSLRLTSAVPTFAWTTITDVVLHLRYTAREGGDLLREAALATLNAELAGLPLRRGFSARAEFGSQWSAFLSPAEGSTQATLSIELAELLFPYIAHGSGLKITNLELVALVKDPGGWQSTDVTVTTGSNAQTGTLIGSPTLYGGQPSTSVAYTSGMPPSTWDISLPTDRLGAPAEWMDDLVVVATYELDLDVG